MPPLGGERLSIRNHPNPVAIRRNPAKLSACPEKVDAGFPKKPAPAKVAVKNLPPGRPAKAGTQSLRKMPLGDVRQRKR
jgi:hypothetical protein